MQDEKYKEEFRQREAELLESCTDYTNTPRDMHTYMSTYTHMHIDTFTTTYMHTHAYVHTYIHTCRTRNTKKSSGRGRLNC
jgi:hypothetical protein